MIKNPVVGLSLCELGCNNEYGCEVYLDVERRKVVIREHRMPPGRPDWIHKVEIDVQTILDAMSPNDKA